MKEINIDRVYPLNRHHNIKILHDFNPLKSFTLSNASLDLHLSRSLISQLCLDNSASGLRENVLEKIKAKLTRKYTRFMGTSRAI